jgi:acyl-CoA thioester hydrolase
VKSMNKCITKMTTRYYETDQMGIIHHSNYYRYFEVARTDYLKNLIGMTYKDIEEQGVRMPLVDNSCKYKTPALYDDELTISTVIREMTVARIVFDYEIIRESDGAFIAQGHTTHALTNAENRPINLKKHNPELFERLSGPLK